MMEIFVFDHEIFGGAWASNNDRLNVLQMGQPVGTCVFRGPLEEVVRCFFDEPLETLSRLATLAVLAHDV